MSTTRKPLWRILALTASLSLVAGACSDDGGDGDEDAAGTTETTAEATEEECTRLSEASEPETEIPGEGELVIGTLLPETGSLAFLGPPEFAAAELAVEEINNAGGVFGADVTLENSDSGDTTTDIANQSVGRLLDANATVIVGAASSSVSFTVIDRIIGAGVVQFSPANTSKRFSTYEDNGLYFRTAPSDILQGQILGEIIVEDGNATVGIMNLDDDYGTGLAEDLQASIEDSGGEVVEQITYDPNAQSYDAEVQAMISADPDAIVVIGFDESARIISALAEQGAGPQDKKIYGSDGNMGNALGDQVPEGTLEGMRGTAPLSELTGEFESCLMEVDPELQDFNYAGETYDAVVVSALAALEAGSVEGAAIAAEIPGVTKDGTECSTFTECRDLIAEGEDIDYEGASGPIEMQDNGDPGQASFGILEFQADNSLETVEFRLAGG